MRLSKLLLCALVICALAIPAGPADGEETGNPVPETQPPVSQVPETPEPVPATPEPTVPVPGIEEPTLDPTSEPAEEPESKPTQEPTDEPALEPSQEPTSEPTEEPTSEPTEEPTLEPTLEPTPEPSPEPSVSPSVSPEPSAPPLPLPGNIDGQVNITPEGSAVQENDLWRIQLSSPDSPISFLWTVSTEASGHLIYVQSEQEDPIFITETPDTRIDLPSANYAKGRHTLYVGAYLVDGSISWGALDFCIVSGDTPNGGFPGGRPSGSGRPSGGGSAAGAAAEEQGFHVTPGKALTSKHSSGTKNSAAYTCSEINDSMEAITALVLESTQTEIALDSGAAFFVIKEAGKLQLVPESDGGCWKLSALAMNTLAESGIDRVVFHVGGTAYSMPARMEFSGSVYASLRAKGYVSKDMEISVDALGMHISVDGCSYSINDDNELVPCEE